ncbi:hydroxymethyltransferase [Salmonella enterica subsp. enterica]|uniref:Hydroxymethyltransferase n=1 Tax=Salmonella enterica I TaxID=59201 RepID=A0A379X1P6_SALET|nr:hydroxymethyltransferase [Salmonella enterica subsp. enterica]
MLRDTADPVAEGQAIAGFIHELGVYSGEICAGLYLRLINLSVTVSVLMRLPTYGWNATCWLNYLAMVKQVTKALLTPAMLWQIPGGHMPTVEEASVKSALRTLHPAEPFLWVTPALAAIPDTLSLQLLNTALNSATYGVPTVGDFLRKDKGYDWGQIAGAEPTGL